jgi:hypothetical protein
MRLVLARNYLAARQYADQHGLTINRHGHSSRGKYLQYVGSDGFCRGLTLTSADTIVCLPGYDQHLQAERIEQALHVASFLGSPAWEIH